MWVATQEYYPASPVSSASQSLCLDLDAISSEDSDAKSGNALNTSPITVISVDSSDSDPDSSEVHSSTGPSSVPGSLTSSGTSVCVVGVSLTLPTPDEPVVLSAPSSMLISPNHVWEDCISVTAEVYPVFEVSPDTTKSILTSPPAPPSSPMVSLPPPAPTFSPPGAPASLDGLVLAFSLLPRPDVMVLVPVLAPDYSSSLTECSSRGKSAPVLFPLQGSCPGRAPVSDAPSDIGSPGHWVRTMDCEDAVAAALQLQPDAGVMTSNLQVLDQFITSHNHMYYEILRLVVGPEVFPSTTMDVLSPVPRAPRGCSLHIGHGAVAASGWSGCSRAVAGFVMQ